jgi:hypothetical protein
VEHNTEGLKLSHNDDWTSLLLGMLHQTLGYEVNVTDHRLGRCYTGTLCINMHDKHNTLGMIVTGCGVSFAAEEVTAVATKITAQGLIVSITVGLM